MPVTSISLPPKIASCEFRQQHSEALLDSCARCFAHIINICCQHLLASFTNPALADPSESFVASPPHSGSDSQTFAQAVTRDPIALGRVVVRTIRAYGQR